MYVIIQIPCLNEEKNIANVIESVPRAMEGVSRVDVLVIDDGSDDKTASEAINAGANYVVTHSVNRGLARAFETGLARALELGADIIVNTDADEQYPSESIPSLVAPLIRGEAEIAIGDRQINSRKLFSPLKRIMQRIGSAVVSTVSGVKVNDAVCGFRAYSKHAAKKTIVLSDFSYTTETIIQAGMAKLRIVNIPIESRVDTRRSRLAKSMADFILRQGVTIVRALFMYQPLRLFLSLSLAFFLIGLLPFLRFVYFYFLGFGDGHVQSLIMGLFFLLGSFILAAIGILADLVAFNRKILERVLLEVK